VIADRNLGRLNGVARSVKRCLVQSPWSFDDLPCGSPPGTKDETVKVGLAVVLIAGLMFPVHVGLGTATPKARGQPRIVEPKPTSAAPAIRAALRRHRLVALGELHGWEAQHAFFRSLLRNRRLVAAVDDVVVEFGNSRYQSLADRYFLDLETVPREELDNIWLETTQRETGVWSNPIYRRFLEAVRALNERLSSSDRLRVILADPPIDWSTITTTSCTDSEPTCLEHWLTIRNRFFAQIVRREVLARRRSGLLIAGAFHFLRPAKGVTTESVTGYLESSGRQRVYVVVPQTPFARLSKARKRQLASWPEPSIADVRGTWLGKLEVGSVFPRAFVGGQPPPRVPLERVADAYLHL
jgi:hypothetical protein